MTVTSDGSKTVNKKVLMEDLANRYEQLSFMIPSSPMWMLLMTFIIKEERELVKLIQEGWEENGFDYGD